MGYRGVKACGTRWKAEWMFHGQGRYLGVFTTPEAAAAAVDADRMRLGGDPFKLNFPEAYPDATRICTGCEQPKVLDEFRCRVQISPRCRSCRKSRTKPGKAQAYKQSGQRAFVGMLLSHVRHRCRPKQVACTLTVEEVLTIIEAQGGRCALTGTELTYEVGNGHVWSNMSIDRLIPGGDYTRSNIQIVCFWANLARNNLPIPQFIALCQRVVEQAG